MHTLDILVPHYQDPKGLRLSLESIAAQDWHGEKRVIIVDDGSGPECLANVYQISKGSGVDCLVIEHPKNMGRPAARNTLLRAVTAPYVAWLDAGDVWYPRKIGKQMRLLRELEDAGEDTSNVWISCNFDWCENEKTRFVRQKTMPDMFEELVSGNSFRAYLWTLFGRTDAFRSVGFFDEELPRLQDLDYFLRFVSAGGRFATPPKREGLCCYYKSDIGRNHIEVSQSAQHIFDKYRMEIVRRGLGPRVKWNNARLARRFAIKNGQTFASLKYLVQASASNPRYALYKFRGRLGR